MRDYSHLPCWERVEDLEFVAVHFPQDNSSETNGDTRKRRSIHLSKVTAGDCLEDCFALRYTSDRWTEVGGNG